MIILDSVMTFSQHIMRETNPFLLRQRYFLKCQLLLMLKLNHVLVSQRRRVDSVKSVEDGEIPHILMNIPANYEGYSFSLILLLPN